MSRKELTALLAGALLLGGVALWAAITLIDTYAFTDDGNEITMHRR